MKKCDFIKYKVITFIIIGYFFSMDAAATRTYSFDRLQQNLQLTHTTGGSRTRLAKLTANILTNLAKTGIREKYIIFLQNGQCLPEEYRKVIKDCRELKKIERFKSAILNFESEYEKENEAILPLYFYSYKKTKDNKSLDHHSNTRPTGSKENFFYLLGLIKLKRDINDIAQHKNTGSNESFNPNKGISRNLRSRNRKELRSRSIPLKIY